MVHDDMMPVGVDVGVGIGSMWRREKEEKEEEEDGSGSSCTTHRRDQTRGLLCRKFRTAARHSKTFVAVVCYPHASAFLISSAPKVVVVVGTVAVYYWQKNTTSNASHCDCSGQPRQGICVCELPSPNCVGTHWQCLLFSFYSFTF